MKQHHRRSKARAIAIAAADESRAQKTILVRLTLIAVCAMAAILVLPRFWPV